MVSMSGKQLRVQRIFPDYDDTLSFSNNAYGSSAIVVVADEEDFIPDFTIAGQYSVDIDDSRVTVRFLGNLAFTTDFWGPVDFNGFGLHDVFSEISDFEVDGVRVISENVPDGMDVYTDASPLEGSDVFLWNLVNDPSLIQLSLTAANSLLTLLPKTQFFLILPLSLGTMKFLL